MKALFFALALVLGATASPYSLFEVTAAMADDRGAVADGSQELFTSISAAGSSPQTIDKKATSIATSDLPTHPNTAGMTKSAADNRAPTYVPDERGKRDDVARALSAAEIASLIVQTSRQQYYATGHPCACPDDVTRSGRRCGGNSAYSRPGGAAPLCYATDVSDEMIRKYKSNMGPGAGLR
jgi:hypothetical protein